jgi:hypothetical protein
MPHILVLLTCLGHGSVVRFLLQQFLASNFGELHEPAMAQSTDCLTDQTRLCNSSRDYQQDVWQDKQCILRNWHALHLIVNDEDQARAAVEAEPRLLVTDVDAAIQFYREVGADDWVRGPCCCACRFCCQEVKASERHGSVLFRDNQPLLVTMLLGSQDQSCHWCATMQIRALLM